MDLLGGIFLEHLDFFGRALRRLVSYSLPPLQISGLQSVILCPNSWLFHLEEIGCVFAVDDFYKCILVGYMNFSGVLPFCLKNTSYEGWEADFIQYSTACSRLCSVRGDSKSVAAEMLCLVSRLVSEVTSTCVPCAVGWCLLSSQVQLL